MNKIVCTQTIGGYFVASAVVDVTKTPIRILQDILHDIHGNFDQRDAAEYMCRPFGSGKCEFSIIINPHAYDCTLFQLINFQSALSRLGQKLVIDATPLCH